MDCFGSDPSITDKYNYTDIHRFTPRGNSAWQIQLTCTSVYCKSLNFCIGLPIGLHVRKLSENWVLFSFDGTFIVDCPFYFEGVFSKCCLFIALPHLDLLIQPQVQQLCFFSCFSFSILQHCLNVFGDASLSDTGWSNLGISSSRISLFWPACKAPWETKSLRQVVSRVGYKMQQSALG